MLRILSCIIIFMLVISCEEPNIQNIIEPVDTIQYVEMSALFFGESTISYRISFEIMHVPEVTGFTTATVCEYANGLSKEYWLLYGRQEAQCDSLELNYAHQIDLWYDSVDYNIDSIDVFIQIDDMNIETRQGRTI